MKKVTAGKNLKLNKETLHTLGRVSLAGGAAITPSVSMTNTTVDTRRLCEDTWLTV